MPKKAVAAKADSVDDILARIKTKIVPNAESAVEPDSIYMYTLRLQDSPVTTFLQLHGKCAQLELDKYANYIPVITGKFAKDNYEYSRTICNHCGEQLNSRLAKQLKIAQTDQREFRKAEARLAREQAEAIQLEKDKELALLGLL